MFLASREDPEDDGEPHFWDNDVELTVTVPTVTDYAKGRATEMLDAKFAEQEFPKVMDFWHKVVPTFFANGDSLGSALGGPSNALTLGNPRNYPLTLKKVYTKEAMAQAFIDVGCG